MDVIAKLPDAAIAMAAKPAAKLAGLVIMIGAQGALRGGHASTTFAGGGSRACRRWYALPAPVSCALTLLALFRR